MFGATAADSCACGIVDGAVREATANLLIETVSWQPLMSRTKNLSSVNYPVWASGRSGQRFAVSIQTHVDKAQRRQA